MARIKLVEQNEATGAEKERYDELAGRNAVTNMKKGLLNDAATYDAYMAWYTSWNRLVEVIGEKDAILYAHKISTTNSCQLCSLFYISDVKGLGLDPANLVYDEKETLLAQLAEQIVKDPTAVSDELIDNLKKFFRKLGLKTHLSELGIDDRDFEVMAERATAGGTVGHYVPLDAARFTEILKLAL